MKIDLALNNVQWLIYHKIKRNQTRVMLYNIKKKTMRL